MNARKNRPSCILIVEDNPGDVRLTGEVLKEVRQIYRVCVVTDGVEALAYLRRQEKNADAVLPNLRPERAQERRTRAIGGNQERPQPEANPCHNLYQLFRRPGHF